MKMITLPRAALTALALLAAACGGADIASVDAVTTVPAASVSVTEATDNTVAPTTTVDPGPTIPPIPDPAFAAVEAPSDAGLTCAGTRIGISCLIEGEWQSFDSENSPVVEWSRSVEVCPDGRVVTPSPGGVAVFNDGDWGTAEPDFGLGFAEDVACGDDAIWATWTDVIGRFADGVWTSWNNDEVLGSVEDGYRAQAVEVAPDGSAWVTSRSSIARFQDDVWTAWEEGVGFDDRFAPRALAIDASGGSGYEVVVATGTQGIRRFADEAWTSIPGSLNGDDAAFADDGDIWISAHRVGVERYSGGIATEIGLDDGLSSDDVRDIHVDTAGRLWFATSYGITMIADGESRTYRVDNSGLLDNDVYTIAVGDGGPALPADAPEDWGTLTGTMLDADGEPLVDMTVEVCVEILYSNFQADTPCGDHPYFAGALTDADGAFEIANLRAGRYTMSLLPPNGWTFVEDASTAARYVAVAGEVTDVGTIRLLPEEVDENSSTTTTG